MAPNEGMVQGAEAAYLYHNTEVLLREYSRITHPSSVDGNSTLRLIATAGNQLDASDHKSDARYAQAQILLQYAKLIGGAIELLKQFPDGDSKLYDVLMLVVNEKYGPNGTDEATLAKQVGINSSYFCEKKHRASVPYIPDPNELPDQMTATRQTMVAQELMQQEANEAAKKRFGLGKGKKEKPASGVHHAAPAPTQATAEPARPSQKKKSSKVIAAILAVVIVGGVAGYAFVPSVYDGVNGVLTAVTGHQVGVPPVSENGDNDVITPQPTVNQPASGSTDTTSNEVNKVLGDIDMSGDVTIEFYANVKTADGREYKVPLSTANLTDGTLTALLDSGGYPLTQNAQ